MAKLSDLGITGPFAYTADGSVNGTYNGHPYNIHPDVTSPAWNALMEDLVRRTIKIAPYAIPVEAAPDAAQVAKNQIRVLEKSITARRLREAMLTDEGKAWLSDVDAQIAVLRVHAAA